MGEGRQFDFRFTDHKTRLEKGSVANDNIQIKEEQTEPQAKIEIKQETTESLMKTKDTHSKKEKEMTFTGDAKTGFFFGCKTCNKKFLSTKLFRDHSCSDNAISDTAEGGEENKPKSEVNENTDIEASTISSEKKIHWEVPYNGNSCDANLEQDDQQRVNTEKHEQDDKQSVNKEEHKQGEEQRIN